MISPRDGAPRDWATLAFFALLALIAWGLAWELWWAPTGRGTWALKVLPLAAGLAGIRRGRLHTFRWLCLLVWLYVCEGLVRAASDSGLSQPLAVGQVALSVGFFAACVAHIRTQAKPSNHLPGDPVR